MADLEKLGRELERSGKAEALRKLAASAEGQRLAQRLDAGAVEAAARGGDAAALRALLGGVLGTAEGRQLIKSVEELMK
ncbi:MAG: hypothetical protein Q4E38_01465 [Eubacteriales bacterium]|nr:hypothetical protein [Eubacteriales bacterium]